MLECVRPPLLERRAPRRHRAALGWPAAAADHHNAEHRRHGRCAAPPRRGRSRGVPLGAIRVLRLLSRAPWQRGARPRVLEGTEGARGRRASLYGNMGVFGATVGSTAGEQFVQMCAHVHMRRMHSRRARAAQRSRALRAGKYAWGAAGKNVCPDGTTRIDDLTACKTAAAAAGRPSPSISENSDQSPKGCYSSTRSPDVSFNAHVIGQLNAVADDTLLLCAVAGVPASLARPAHGIPAHAPWMPSLPPV